MKRLGVVALTMVLVGCVEKPPIEAPVAPPPVTFFGPLEVAQVALGGEDLCIRLRSGKVICRKDWRGLAVSDSPRSFTTVGGVRDATDVAVGGHHACIRTNLGAVACWGGNAFGEVGVGPDPTRAALGVDGVPQGAAELRLDETRSCARMVDGTVRCWGSVAALTHLPPTVVAGMTGVLGIAVGRGQLCARLLDGTVRCSKGGAPYDIGGLEHVVEIAMSGVEGCARSAEGTVRCWPLETAPANPDKPVAIKDHGRPDLSAASVIVGLDSIAQLAAGRAHTCARGSLGTVSCWGDNDYGQLGDGSRSAHAAPEPVKGINDAVELAAGGDRTCVRRSTGAFYCWGRDLLDDPMFHALTGKQAPPGPPGEFDSLRPELLRIPEHED
jgi:hypothetical protein